MDDELEAEIERLRARSGDFARLLWEALSYGDVCVQRAYAEWGDDAVDTATFNAITRSRARRYMQQRGPALADWTLDTRVTNSGISVITGGHWSKVYKAVHGTARNGTPARIPALAKSRANRAFMSQMVQPTLFLGLSAFEDALRDVEANLLWLWDHDEQHHINHVWLVLPVSASRARVIAKFQVEIPDPLKKPGSGATEPKVQDVSDDLDDEIQLPPVREDETGTEE